MGSQRVELNDFTFTFFYFIHFKVSIVILFFFWHAEPVLLITLSFYSIVIIIYKQVIYKNLLRVQKRKKNWEMNQGKKYGEQWLLLNWRSNVFLKALKSKILKNSVYA